MLLDHLCSRTTTVHEGVTYCCLLLPSDINMKSFIILLLPVEGKDKGKHGVTTYNVNPSQALNPTNFKEARKMG